MTSINSEGVCWFAGLDGRTWRHERSRDGKSRMMSVWSWAAADAPPADVRVLMVTAPDDPRVVESFARGTRRAPVMV
jgi:hypothetical protein